ncbi:MAG: hypothetical protein KC496_09590 [Anaerolineae bacterium]|nr:hypothetical protein [Anaerolineae bacterium]
MKLSPQAQAYIGGGIIFLAAIIGAFFIGRIYSDTQARDLIEAMAPSLRTLCFAIITAAATMISLLLTTVSFTHQIDNTFDKSFYGQIRLIARLSTIALILAVSVLLALSIPLTESDALRPWFSAAYYLLTLAAATLAAFIVATIILLFQTMSDIIYVVNQEFRDET